MGKGGGKRKQTTLSAARSELESLEPIELGLADVVPAEAGAPGIEALFVDGASAAWTRHSGRGDDVLERHARGLAAMRRHVSHVAS